MNLLMSNSSPKNVKITYFLDKQESSIQFLPSKNIGDLKRIIHLSSGIDLNKYEMIYKKNKIDNGNDHLPLQLVIGNDTFPIIFIKPLDRTKEIKAVEINYKHSNLNSLKSLISIWNFPKNVMLNEFINMFMIKKKTMNSFYQTEEKGNITEIIFYENELAIQFYKELTSEKLHNEKFRNIKLALKLDYFDEKAKIHHNMSNKNQADYVMGKPTNAKHISNMSIGSVIGSNDTSLHPRRNSILINVANEMHKEFYDNNYGSIKDSKKEIKYLHNPRKRQSWYFGNNIKEEEKKLEKSIEANRKISRLSKLSRNSLKITSSNDAVQRDSWFGEINGKGAFYLNRKFNENASMSSVKLNDELEYYDNRKHHHVYKNRHERKSVKNNSLQNVYNLITDLNSSKDTASGTNISHIEDSKGLSNDLIRRYFDSHEN